MAHGSSPLSRRETFESDTEEDIQTQAALTRNESPSSAIPVPTRISEEGQTDIEHGEEESTPLIRETQSPPPRPNWRNLASFSLSALSGEAAWRQAQADRNR
jgi:hypothetical protein